MPRPRTATDAEILEGAARAIARLGPGRLTLADVAREVGLSPATLLQRFGSKRGLLLALAGNAAGTVDACFAAARRATGSSLGALLSAATEMARHVESPEALANHLAFLQVDLSDPDFHTLALALAQRTLAGYETLLRDAVTAGELVPCDIAPLARSIQAMTGGSLINWAIHRQGGVLDWVHADLDSLLAPYRRVSEAPGASSPRPAPRTRHRPLAARAALAPSCVAAPELSPQPPSPSLQPRPRRRNTPGTN